MVAGPRIGVTTDEGYALALSEEGEVYSWGRGSKGRLGHNNNDNVKSPKLIEALAGKNIKMVNIIIFFLLLLLFILLDIML